MILKRIPQSIFPVRYVGGKQKVLPKLHEHLPHSMEEIRDVFVGGGSMVLSLMWANKNAKYWINDGNDVIYSFWKHLRLHPQKMHDWILEKKREYPTEEHGEALFSWCVEKMKTADDFESGCVWYILNRIAYNGHGTYSSTEYFTEERIDKLKCCADLMRSVDLTITNYDYSVLLTNSPKNTFVFLDPPYQLGKVIRYGELHRQFDHDVFSKVVKKSRRINWLMTYNDKPKIRQLYADFKISPLTMRYKKDGKTAVELVIKNY
jgi:DNA adenine methylase